MLPRISPANYSLQNPTGLNKIQPQHSRKSTPRTQQKNFDKVLPCSLLKLTSDIILYQLFDNIKLYLNTYIHIKLYNYNNINCILLSIKYTFINAKNLIP
jgi:hypothetical protein